MNVCPRELVSHCPPVLYLIFNRPDIMEHSFAKIREARPAQLFVAADGPRPERDGEVELCAEARRIVDQVDWPCDVKSLFRDKNLGCRKAVSEAITWFFEHVEEGLILEDDCVSDSSFFPFCAELLERYRDDERIMVISGNSFQSNTFDITDSYYFSIYPHCWGWATWRRAWSQYASMDRWSQLRSTRWLTGLLQRREIAEYFSRRFDALLDNKLDSWASQWFFSCCCNSGLTILPSVNLVTNVGIGESATNTVNVGYLQVQPKEVKFPLSHPSSIVRDFDADLYSAYHVFQVSRFPHLAKCRRRLRQRFPLLFYFARRIPVRLRILLKN